MMLFHMKVAFLIFNLWDICLIPHNVYQPEHPVIYCKLILNPGIDVAIHRNLTHIGG